PVDAAGGGQVRVLAGEDAHDRDALAPELFHLLGGVYDAGLPAVELLPARVPVRYLPVVIGAGVGEYHEQPPLTVAGAHEPARGAEGQAVPVPARGAVVEDVLVFPRLLIVAVEPEHRAAAERAEG